MLFMEIVKFTTKNFKRNIKSEKIQNLKDKMIFSHQSCFVKTIIQKKFLFEKKLLSLSRL